MRPVLVLASRNRHKFQEYQALLADVAVELRSLEDYPQCPLVEETGETFLANALLKARAAVRCTGLPALADDSGLEVDALGGAPGVRSARFAGEFSSDEANNAKLLRLLQEVPPERRTARFRCVIAVVFPNGREEWVEGVCEGTIALAPRGEEGFGYDPLFLVAGMGKTMAELSLEEKNRVSHRGRAMEALKARWSSLFTEEPSR